MIRYNPKDWFSLIFHAYSREVMRTLLPNMLFIAIYTAGVVYVVDYYFGLNLKLGTQIHSLLGFVLGLFLVFRTNTAYDRWWEGRKLWGAMVNNCRNFSMKLAAFLPEDAVEDRAWFARMIPNYPYAMKEHLRSGVKLEEMELTDAPSTESMAAWEHQPNYLALHMYRRLNKLYQEKHISGDQLFLLDKELKAFTDIVGACERIHFTPIPYSYSMYMKKFIFLYILTLPFGLFTTFHWWTIPMVVMVFYILVATELIAEEIEDPFGLDVNDLDTDGLSGKIRNNVKEILIKNGPDGSGA